MIFIQTYFIYEKSNYQDCTGSSIDEKNFINMAKVSNFLLNKTEYEIHFWGNQKSIDFVKSIGLKYHKYFSIPEEAQIQKYKNLLTLNRMYVSKCQTQDFYMVDLDFFLFKSIAPPKEKEIYVQHYEWYAEPITKEWSIIIDQYLKNKNISDVNLLDTYQKISKINIMQNYKNMYNLGFFGGCAKDIVPIYKFLYEFIIKNNLTDAPFFLSIVMEQVWAPIISNTQGLGIKPLWSNTSEFYEKNWCRFNENSKNIGYSHLMNWAKKEEDNFKNLKIFISENSL